MRHEEKSRRIAEQPQRSIEHRRTDQRERRADVHGIADESVGPADHQLSRWIEWRGGPPAEAHEAQNAPERDRGAGGGDDRADDLRPADRGRTAEARREPRRQVDQQEPDEERGVDDGAEENEHFGPARREPRLLIEPHLLQQLAESRLSAERVQTGMHLEEHHRMVVHLVAALEPAQGLLGLAPDGME